MSRVVHVISIESRLDNFCDLYINAALVAALSCKLVRISSV